MFGNPSHTEVTEFCSKYTDDEWAILAKDDRVCELIFVDLELASIRAEQILTLAVQEEVKKVVTIPATVSQNKWNDWNVPRATKRAL